MNHMKIVNILFLSGALALLPESARAAVVDYMPISIEQASQVTGPWTAARVAAVTGDGKLLVPAEFNQGFWRLEITPSSKLGFSLGLPLINVPPATLKIAQDFLAAHSSRLGEEGQSESEWGSVRLADVATPMYDPAVDGGRTPAYIEFKVIANVGDPTVGDPSVGDPSGLSPVPVRRDRGFIQVSLTENDFPIVGWSTEGRTPMELLREQAGTGQIKPMMFGAGLLIGETPGGRTAAMLGSLLPKPHPELMQFADFVGSAIYDSETGESNRTPALPLESPLGSYASYQEMKDDYNTNDFYVSARARKREAARIEWLLTQGATFPHLNVAVGDPVTLFAGREVLGAKLHTPDNETVARVSPLGHDGLRVEGLSAGGGVLQVQFAGAEEFFALLVGDPSVGDPSKTGPSPQGIAQVFVPSWKQTRLDLAGTWENQCWYSQFQSTDFGGGGAGNYVGCGPVAWTMLMGWWDHQGVSVAFKPKNHGSGIAGFQLGLPDAPKNDVDSSVRSMMRNFRYNWVDPLYCDSISGNCGTPPDKMVNGSDYFGSLCVPYNAVYLPYIGKEVLNYGYVVSYTWVSYNGLNDHNKLARESIQKGWPSIMGIGFLSHYILAYAYKEERYEVAPGSFIGMRSFLRANWGNGTAKWINFQNDWFFATKYRLGQKLTQFQAP